MMERRVDMTSRAWNAYKRVQKYIGDVKIQTSNAWSVKQMELLRFIQEDDM